MRDCLNQLEESRNFSAGALQANLANKTISIAGRGLESQMLCVSLHYRLPVMANSASYVFLLYRPVSAWSGVHKALITFLVYLSTHTFAVKYPKQNQWFDKWWSLPCFLLRHYCMMLLAFDAPSSSYSARIRVSFPYRTNIIVAGLLQSLQIITHTWSVSASCQGTLFDPKTLFNCIVVLG